MLTSCDLGGTVVWQTDLALVCLLATSCRRLPLEDHKKNRSLSARWQDGLCDRARHESLTSAHSCSHHPVTALQQPRRTCCTLWERRVELLRSYGVSTTGRKAPVGMS